MKSHVVQEFQCEHCDKKFLRKAHMKRHVEIVHNSSKILEAEIEYVDYEALDENFVDLEVMI